MLRPGDQVAGFRVDAVIGKGGMGVVYEATQLSLERKVALKVLAPDLAEDEDFRRRFRREGRLQAAADHPNIVTVHEAGETEQGLYIAMRLIRGPTLRDLVRGVDRDDRRLVHVLDQVAGALDAAHEVGLVHRDVKPANVLIGPQDHAFLADFGITRSRDTNTLTQTGMLLGTLAYVAPEVINGGPPSAASDLYAFAAMTYECLTGAQPYPREHDGAVLQAHLTEPVPSVRGRRPDLPAAVDAVISAGMAKDPADRPPSARAFLGRLQAALGTRATGDRPLPAHSTPTRPQGGRETATVVADGPRPPRPGRRGRVAAGAAAVVVAAAIGVAALGGGGGDGGDDRSGPDGAAGSENASVPASGAGSGVGSLLPAPGLTTGCSGGATDACTIVQSEPEDAARIDEDRTVSRWRLRGARGRFRLVVIRGDPRARVVARSDQVTVRDPGVTEQATRLQVRAGDRVGLEVAPRSVFGLADLGGARLHRWIPPLAGAPRAPDHTDPADLELLLAWDFAP